MADDERQPQAPKRLLVVKVPLNYVPEVAEADFGRIKPPYLELLENKARVKDALRNQDYDPDLLIYPNPPSREGSSKSGERSNRGSRVDRLITTSDVSRRLHVPRDEHREESKDEVRDEPSGDEEPLSAASERASQDSDGASSVDEYRQRVHNSYRDDLIQQDQDRRDREKREREDRAYHSSSSVESDTGSISRADRVMRDAGGSNRFSRYLMEGGDRSNLAPRIVRERGGRGGRGSEIVTRIAIGIAVIEIIEIVIPTEIVFPIETATLTEIVIPTETVTPLSHP